MTIDPEALALLVLGEGGLREQYPDDGEFADALGRLAAMLGGEGEGGEEDDEGG